LLYVLNCNSIISPQQEKRAPLKVKAANRQPTKKNNSKKGSELPLFNFHPKNHTHIYQNPSCALRMIGKMPFVLFLFQNNL